MTQLFTDNAEAYVSTDHTAGTTTLAVDDASNFASPSSGDFQEITLFPSGGSLELAKVIGRSGNILTLESGLGQDIPDGTLVRGTLSANALDNLRSTLKGYVEKTGTAETLSLADFGMFIGMNNNAANVLTVPPESSVNFPLMTQIQVVQMGVGQTSIQGDTGVTILSSVTNKIKQQYGVVALIKISSDTWVLTGEREV